MCLDSLERVRNEYITKLPFSHAYIVGNDFFSSSNKVGVSFKMNTISNDDCVCKNIEEGVDA